MGTVNEYTMLVTFILALHSGPCKILKQTIIKSHLTSMYQHSLNMY